ncbi:MAG: hypothetical protein IPN20_03630, partial [Haliscomenobacter sp.]|nr:hypothetical protein [Haliscomenobacter sp.]
HDYYQVYRPTPTSGREITPTARAAFSALPFPERIPHFILVDRFFGGSEITIDPTPAHVPAIARTTMAAFRRFHQLFCRLFQQALHRNPHLEGFPADAAFLQSQGNHAGASCGCHPGRGEDSGIPGSVFALSAWNRRAQPTAGDRQCLFQQEIKSRAQKQPGTPSCSASG